MARILGISEVHLGRLSKAGSLPQPVERGKWNVVQCVQAFLAHKIAAFEPQGEGVKSEELLLVTARRVKTEAEADAQEMKNALMRRDLLRREDVDAAATAAFARVRARLLAVPPKVAPVVVTDGEPAIAERTVRAAIYEALKELSDSTLGDLCGNDYVMVADAGAAAGTDGEPMGGPGEAT